MEDEERSKRPTKFEDEELTALLDEDYCQTQEQHTESFKVAQAAVLKRLEATEYIEKLDAI